MTRWPIKHALVAAILLAIELLFGLGIIGVPAAILAAVVLLGGKQRIGVRLQVAALYVCVSVLTFTWLVYNVHLAKRRAILQRVSGLKPNTVAIQRSSMS